MLTVSKFRQVFMTLALKHGWPTPLFEWTCVTEAPEIAVPPVYPEQCQKFPASSDNLYSLKNNLRNKNINKSKSEDNL